MSEAQDYTLFIYAENSVGLLNRMTLVFTRRSINIKSITVSESEVKDVSRYTIVVFVTLIMVKRLSSQIQKQVEVIDTSYHTLSQTIHQEIALYKISISTMVNEAYLEEIIRDSNAAILTVTRDHFIVEKTGHKEETQKLLERLKPFGLVDFVRSGRVSLSKPLRSIADRISGIENDGA